MIVYSILLLVVISSLSLTRSFIFISQFQFICILYSFTFLCQCCSFISARRTPFSISHRTRGLTSFFLTMPGNMQDLSSPTRGQTHVPCTGTTREVPSRSRFFQSDQPCCPSSPFHPFVLYGSCHKSLNTEVETFTQFAICQMWE